MEAQFGAAKLEKIMATANFTVFVYRTRQDRKAGEMEYTVSVETLDGAAEIAAIEISEGMYCASIYQKNESLGGPLQFLEAHIRPDATGPWASATAARDELYQAATMSASDALYR